MIPIRDLPRGTAEIVKRETRGEIIRWMGRPHAGRAFRAAFGIYVIAVPWCAVTFTVFGALFASALSGKPPPRPIPMWEYWMMGAAVVFAFVFAALGLAMLVSPWWAWRKARSTVHVVTDRRVVTVVGGRETRVEAIPAERIRRLTRTERRDGSGTIRIVTGYGKDSDGDWVEDATVLYEVPSAAAAGRAVEALERHQDLRWQT